jgi:hypothetical protein
MTMQRPAGVTILGVLVILSAIVLALAGFAGLIVGFASLLPGINLPTGQLFLGALLYLFLAIVLFAAGVGLLGLRPWAWWLATLASLIALAWQALGIYYAKAAIPITSWASLIVTGIIFVYLLTVFRSFHRHVRAAVAA